MSHDQSDENVSSKDKEIVKYKILILTLGFAGFISAADNWFISPALPAVASEFSVPISEAGAILTAYMIPYGLMQPVYGFFSDCLDKRVLLERIVGGLAIGTAFCAISKSLLIICIWRMFTGFFAAGIIAVSLALIGDTVPTLDRQEYVGKFMGIVFLGQGLSSGLGGGFAKYISWRVVFVLFAITAVLSVICLHRLPKNESSMVNKNNNFFHEVKLAVLTPKGKVIFPLALAAGFLLLGIYSYLGSFLHEVIGLDYLQVGIVIMFYGFACLFGGTNVGKVSNKFGKKGTIILGASLGVISIILLSTMPYWQAGLIATITLGFAYIFIQSTLATIAFDVTSEAKGLPSGLIGLGLFCGGGLGSAAGGYLIKQGGYSQLWFTFIIGIAIFTFIVFRLRFE